jgi:DNA mismatch repair protein MutL
MGQIKVLPQELINQIAAGEVIERPASVVKELMENSLDSAALRIDVEMNGSGLELIRVSDDGAGMSGEELELAIQRHATSKIATVDDLFAIRTLGFRGEALPSILSVSRTIISTRSASSPQGCTLSIEAGEVLKRGKKGMPQGTIVEVADLFFNTPARKKFLKTSATEQRHVMDVISRYALACPQVRFSLRINGRHLLSFTATSDLMDRATSVFGTMQAKDLIPLRQEKPGITVHGIIAPPSETRSNRSGIYTFVNGRSVREALLGAAVIEGYSGMLMKGRYPVAVVFIEIDPTEVDVNVHPSKAEVRFRHAGAVFGIIASSIGGALMPSSVQKEYSFGIAMARKDAPRDDIKGGQCEEPKATWQSRGVQGQDGSLFDKGPSPQPATGFYSSKAVIGMLHNTYVLLQDISSLYILDQHAAHERVTFERLKAIHTSGTPKTQLLLSPIILELSRSEYSVFEEVAGHISEIGIEAEPFGGTTIAVRAVPHLLAGSDISLVIRDLIHDVLDGAIFVKKDGSEHLKELMATVACHASVRAGKALNLAEASALLRELDEVGSPLTCPHGRPLFKKIDREEIERWIGRRP